ncbi:hypothetical protein FRC04_010296 [Tulasnella sp. 424]|nr:hypothetical protein FRC04_010296 [Tulasnella sp. 424]
MTKSTAATILFCLGLTSSWLNTVEARAAHERYDPYGYISSTSSSTATPTLSDIAISTSIPDVASTSTSSDGVLVRRGASTSSLASTSTTSAIPAASTTGISIVSVGSPKPPQDPVYYIANGFFANWHALSPSDASFASTTGSGVVGKTFGLDDVKWDLLDSLTYGYIPIPISNFANISLGLQDAAMIPKFVELANTNNVTSILSLGGHISSPNTGGSASTGFAAALATNETITEFVQGVSSLVKKLGVQGIEFDWEWTPCSPDTPYTSKELSTAFLSFLQQLRSELDPEIIITLAVGVVPFETPQIVLSDDEVEDTPLESISLVKTDPDLTDGATVATTLNGEYKNVTGFAAVVDYITVMNFDLYGAWSIDNPIVLPNSPLNQTCPSTAPTFTSKMYSFLSTDTVTNDTTTSIASTPAPPLSRLPISANTAVASWVLSGFRSDQIILGVSAAGRSYRVAEADAVGLDDNGDQVLMLYPPFNTTEVDATLNATAAGAVRAELGDAWWWGDIASSLGKNASSSSSSSSVSGSTTSSSGTVSASAAAVTTSAACVLPSELSTISGVYTFQGLIEAGFLNDTGDVDGGCEDDSQPADYIGGWDECSETPFVYDVQTGIMVSYDDAESMELKGQFILNSGIRGFSFYELGGDSSDATLLTAVRHGAGFADPADGTDNVCTETDDSSTDDLTVTDWEGILQTAVDSWLAATSNTTTTDDVTTDDTTIEQPTVTITVITDPTTTVAPIRRKNLRWERTGGKFWWW